MLQPSESSKPAPGAPAAAKQPAKAKPEVAPAKVVASMAPISDAAFGYDQARHLLWRAGFGGTPRQIQTLASWGPRKSVDYLVDYEQVKSEPIAGDLFDKDIMRPPNAEEREMQAKARRERDEELLNKLQQMRQQRERQDRVQVAEMQKWWLKRIIETGRPLEERMTLFWHGHFATSYRTIENSYHMFMQNGMFRKHATGNFSDLLFGIIRDPAMLAYLNNNTSRKGKPNENLAREIMELFALGIGAYTENDIKEGARALTGYTYDDDKFVFQKNNHDEGAKKILGRQGNYDGDEFVKIILEQPACGAYITRKIYSYFVRELPPLERAEDNQLPSEVRGAMRDLASTFARSKYEIKPLLKRLFMSEHFYSPAFVNEQIKSPVQLAVGAVRSLNTPVRDLSILNDAMDLMGQNLLFPPSVKGWDGGRTWINTSTLYVRQNLMAFLITGKKPQGYDPSSETEKYDPTPLIAELAKAEPGAERNPERVAEYLLKLTIGHASERVRRPLLDFLAKHDNRTEPDHLRGLLLLITAMPEYQLC